MVQVKFTTNGANSAFGGFAAGDTLRCSEAMAAHLVNEVRCAQYAGSPVEHADEAATDTNKRWRKPKTQG